MGVPQAAERGTGGAALGRRAFLAGLAAALALLAAGRAGARRPLRGDAALALAGLLRAPESAAAVGARYLDAHPGERAAALRLARRIAALPRSERRGALRLESARDFADGRVVAVSGWLLSRTEARLCAAVRLGAAR